MKSISYKKALLTIGLSCAILLIASAGMVIFVDPFFQYHKPLPFLNYVIDNQTSQNAGMLKTFDYDSVILGSSMTSNFDTNLFAQLLDTNTLKLSTNAAFPQDIDFLLSMIQKYHEKTDIAFIGIDPSNYSTLHDSTSNPYPEYLYDDNLLNDISYLLNKDVLLTYIIKPQVQHTNTPLNEAYWFWQYYPNGKDMIAVSWSEPEITGISVPQDAYLDASIQNMQTFILPHIEEMTDTDFIFFFPPYSILYWYDCMAEGSIEAYMAEIEQITAMLLEYPNVRVFYFQNDFNRITNYDNYIDSTHYLLETNNFMTQCFADGNYELTEETYKSVLEEARDWFLSYDYLSCW